MTAKKQQIAHNDTPIIVYSDKNFISTELLPYHLLYLIHSISL